MDFGKLAQEYVQLQQFTGALKTSVGAALNKDQQLFVSGALDKFLPFIQSDEGRIAVAQFVQDWEDCTKKTKNA